MKKLAVLVLAAVFVLGSAVGMLAVSGATSITALLDPGITITLDGEPQSPLNVNGEVVYPISYNGSVYVPVRGIGNFFGVPATWDDATRSVLLGEVAEVAPTTASAPPMPPPLCDA